jgi:hypothetical protein
MARGLLLQSIAGVFGGQPRKLVAGTPVCDGTGCLAGDVNIGSAYNANLIQGATTPSTTVPTGADSVQP